jgi:hypothetical protein
MAIVWPCQLSVETYAAAGKSIDVPRPDCPGCSGQMSFWGSYKRDVRAGDFVRILVRRVRCRACRCTHALLPDFLSHGRLDPVEVIGRAITEMVEGAGARTAAKSAGVPHSTARHWRRRFKTRAAMLAAGFSAVVVALGDLVPRLAACPARAALAAISAAVAAARRRLSALGSHFRIANRIVGGHLVSASTDPLFRGA